MIWFTAFIERGNGGGVTWSGFQSTQNWEQSIPGEDRREKSRFAQTEINDWKRSSGS